MAYALGIDIGTTFCAAAVAFDDGRVELINLGGRAASIPSVVYIGANGESLAGDAAETRASVDPTRIGREFKRRLGDPTPLILGGTAFSAESLTTILVRHMLEHVVRRMGGPPSSVVVTHPASYSAYRLELLRNAVVAAGIANPLLISEPAAAAAHYESMAPVAEGEIIAVYDFGGGTFDIALLRRKGSGFELMDAPSGVDRLGGIDFDVSLVQRVDEALGGALGRLDPEDDQTLAVLAKLRRDCRDAKETLSSDSEAFVSVIAPGVSSQVRITRAELEALIRPRLAETFAALRRVVEASKIRVEDIARILLVGGSSRIPLIRDEVRVRTGRPVAEDIDSEHAVALGAARLAARPLRQRAAVTPPTPTVSVAAVPTAAVPMAFAFQPAAAPAPASRPDRRTLVLIGGAVAVVLAIVLGIVVFSGGDDNETATTDETDETVEETDPDVTDPTTPVTETVASTVAPETTLLLETTLAPETTALAAVTVAPTLPTVTSPPGTTAPATVAPPGAISGPAVEQGLRNLIATTDFGGALSVNPPACPAGDLVELAGTFADIAPLDLNGDTVQGLSLDDKDLQRDNLVCRALGDAGFLALGVIALRPEQTFDLEQLEILQADKLITNTDPTPFSGGELIGFCRSAGDITVCGAAWFADEQSVAIILESTFEDFGFDVALEALQRILPTVAEGMAKL